MMTTAYTPGNRTAAGGAAPPDTEPAPRSGDCIASVQGRVRILIASQQPMTRHGLRALLVKEPDLEVIAETGDGQDAVQMARRLRPDIVMIDLSMPTVNGIPATRMIRGELRGTQVIVMNGVDEDMPAVESIRAGAIAYLRTDSRIENVLRSIRVAGADQVMLPAQTAGRLARGMARHGALTERETEVLCLVARGLANKQVARELGVALSTVKHHVSAIIGKLGLSSRTQVALYAVRAGLVALERSAQEHLAAN
jgi:DNA-binding NarL/FixJ family response regulator